jgi:glutamate racemase
MTIGVLDSGIGGTSILQGLELALPQHRYIYQTDSKNFPFSNKSQQLLQKIAKENVDILISKGAQLIVIACNTLTVAAIDFLRKGYPTIPFVGTVPAIKKAAESLPKDATIVVLSTIHTAESEYLAELIDSYSKGQQFICIGTTDLVTAVEEQDPEQVEYVLSLLLDKRSKEDHIDGIIIGCTHFSLVEKEIRDAVGYPVKIFDPIEGIVNRVKQLTTLV